MKIRRNDHEKTKIFALVLACILCVSTLAMLASCSNSTGDDSTAYDSGYEAGYSEGYEAGYDEGYYDGYDEGYYDGYDEGYYYGYEDGVADATPEDDNTTDEEVTE